MNNLDNLQEKIGYKFKNLDLLVQALTHQSYANDNSTISYERLEFLGDAVIELIVSDYIYNNFEIDSGNSTKLRASLVSTSYLSKVSEMLELDKIAYKSKSLQKMSKKNIADLFESVMGAVYIDGGMENAKQLIMKFIIIDDINVGQVIKNSIDYKSRLQEYMQAEGKTFEYTLLAVVGPDHQRQFKVSLDVDGMSVATAVGTSIRSAEEKCAEAFLNSTLYNK